MKGGKVQSARCKGCGREIVWGRTVEGKTIPLDPAAPVYQLSETANGPNGEVLYVALMDSEARRTVGVGVMVSHFSTCPAADRFSASRRAAAAPASSPEPAGTEAA